MHGNQGWMVTPQAYLGPTCFEVAQGHQAAPTPGGQLPSTAQAAVLRSEAMTQPGLFTVPLLGLLTAYP